MQFQLNNPPRLHQSHLIQQISLESFLWPVYVIHLLILSPITITQSRFLSSLLEVYVFVLYHSKIVLFDPILAFHHKESACMNLIQWFNHLFIKMTLSWYAAISSTLLYGWTFHFKPSSVSESDPNCSSSGWTHVFIWSLRRSSFGSREFSNHFMNINYSAIQILSTSFVFLSWSNLCG